MLRTISVGLYISVQGTFLRDCADGRIAVKVGDKVFVGYPIQAKAA
ncbi:translation initiation factor IF-2 [Defluviimonas sp. 20V17]|nr:hypothetical protein [Allgaiera indica]KDB03540.1 translation initiation factor IF-2 [Defluviimonas sp. 20V17]SDW47427.1 hypothetical protein SAMN05444006_10419 [Allgaiera indica]